MAAARALRSGDPLGALKHIALRDDGPALALRGIAMAQLGDFSKARLLLRRAARKFGPHESVERARCATAEAEVALASRDLSWPTRGLEEARRTFESSSDTHNRLYAALLQIRRLLLLGRVAEATMAYDTLDLRAAPAMLRARGELVAFELSLRKGHAAPARAAVLRARTAAKRAALIALSAEVDRAEHTLNLPVARLVSGAQKQALTLAEVEVLLTSQCLIVDACRRSARLQHQETRLARRPVLFALLRHLAEAWPGHSSRDSLCQSVFGVRRMNDSHRARLRVEVGRLRKALRPFAEVHPTQDGFALAPDAERVVILAPPIEGPGGGVLALLAEGDPWSASAIALVLGTSPRTTQRTLGMLERAGQIRSVGSGRTRRWVAPPLSGFATTLLLPDPPGLR